MDITLRELEPEDLDFLYRMENDESLWLFGTCNHPTSRYALRQYLAAQPSDIFSSGQMRLMVVINEGEKEKTVGLVDLTSHSPTDCRAEVGIAILAKHRGKGYGLQTLIKLEEFATSQLRIHLLYAYVSVKHNPVSRKLFERAGYSVSAIVPDWHFCNGTYEDAVLYTKVFKG